MDCNAGAAELLYFSDINAYRQSTNISRNIFSLLIGGKGSTYILLDPETSLEYLTLFTIFASTNRSFHTLIQNQTQESWKN